MRTKTLLILIALLTATGLFAQDQGYLDGKVVFDDKNEAAFNATVRVFQGNKLILGAITDNDGKFRIKPLNPGKYSVVITHVGYHPDTIINVPVSSGQGTDLATRNLIPNTTLIVVEVEAYREPIINKNGAMTHSMTRDQVDKLPNPVDVVSNLQYISSEFQVEPGTREIHFRGSRDGETAFYVDGVRVDSPDGIPKFAMSSMKVYAGGVPARYGDFTGGVVVVETMSYFDWEQEQRSLMLALERSKAPKREKAKVEDVKKEEEKKQEVEEEEAPIKKSV